MFLLASVPDLNFTASTFQSFLLQREANIIHTVLASLVQSILCLEQWLHLKSATVSGNNCTMQLLDCLSGLPPAPATKHGFN